MTRLREMAIEPPRRAVDPKGFLFENGSLDTGSLAPLAVALDRSLQRLVPIARPDALRSINRRRRSSSSGSWNAKSSHVASWIVR